MNYTINLMSFKRQISRGIEWKWLEKKISTRKKVFLKTSKIINHQKNTQNSGRK